MSRKIGINRRDFMNGMALSLAGSYEVAHAVGWTGSKFPIPSTLTDDIYDLVVVGGRIPAAVEVDHRRDRLVE